MGPDRPGACMHAWTTCLCLFYMAFAFTTYYLLPALGACMGLSCWWHGLPAVAFSTCRQREEKAALSGRGAFFNLPLSSALSELHNDQRSLGVAISGWMLR